MKNRVVKWVLGLLAGVGLATGLPSEAAPPAAPVPQHWISYAEMVGNQFAEWLSDPQDENVVQLHTWLQDRVLKDGQPPLQPMVARVWVGPRGLVERLDVPTVGDAGADAKVRKLLMSRPLPEPPPPDMRQPIMLQLSLDFPDSTAAR
ncbi:YbaB/EbfC family DNA-binding protein [Herbaspirillum robiniae]|uniref:YbaB/EbfC family DNA-binding protein n=1 Tax=Herbaspirillum robiniae TaxID=2014887 RepID=UPI00101AD703|nr:YbaB/EbfC family DNA-binding protein [Herbaspirillum robiniae]